VHLVQCLTQPVTKLREHGVQVGGKNKEKNKDSKNKDKLQEQRQQQEQKQQEQRQPCLSPTKNKQKNKDSHVSLLPKEQRQPCLSPTKSTQEIRIFTRPLKSRLELSSSLGKPGYFVRKVLKSANFRRSEARFRMRTLQRAMCVQDKAAHPTDVL